MHHLQVKSRRKKKRWSFCWCALNGIGHLQMKEQHRHARRRRRRRWSRASFNIGNKPSSLSQGVDLCQDSPLTQKENSNIQHVLYDLGSNSVFAKKSQMPNRHKTTFLHNRPRSEGIMAPSLWPKVPIKNTMSNGGTSTSLWCGSHGFFFLVKPPCCLLEKRREGRKTNSNQSIPLRERQERRVWIMHKERKKEPAPFGLWKGNKKGFEQERANGD